MPTYEYACSACAHQWESVQRITEAPLIVCPNCSKSTAHRLISAGTNFILKGGGWYSDLYASPKAAAKKSEATETPAGAGPASEAKSDSKAESGTGSSPSAEAKPVAKPAAAPAPGGPSSSTAT